MSTGGAYTGGLPGRNRRVDAFRVAAALLVVAIHTSPLTTVSEMGDFILTRIIARVAVPFFLMVTGYFVLPHCLMPGKLLGRRGNRGKSGKTPGAYFRGYEKKQVLLYGFAILLYLPVNWYAGNLRGAFRLSDVARELVFEGTFYHLWYLPGVILGLLLVYLANRVLSYGGVLLISLLLYLAGLGGDSYYGLVSQWEPARACYQWIFGISPYTRNGIFYVPLFLWMGYGMARGRILGEMADRRRSGGSGYERADRGKAAYIGEIGLAVSSLLMLAEGIWLHNNKWQRHDSMYLFLPVVMGFLFYLLVRENPRGRRGISEALGGQEAQRETAGKGERGIFTGLTLPEWTTWVYLLHPIGILLVRGAAKAVKCKALIENSLLHYTAVVLVSAGLAAGFCVAVGYLKSSAILNPGRHAGNRRKKRSRRMARRRRRE